MVNMETEIEFYLDATESTDKNDKVKSSILLTCVGPRAREIYNTFVFDPADGAMKLDAVLKKYEEHFNPQKNVTFLRYKFFTYRQQEDQSFTDYTTELTKLSKDCEFEAKRDSLLRDMIIIGLRDKKLQERLLSETDLTLDKVKKKGQTTETTKSHAKIIQKASTPSVSVDAVNYQSANWRDNKRHNTSYKSNDQRKPSYNAKPNNNGDRIEQCKFCSYSHKRGRCPAYRKKCIHCQGLNHFAICCPNKSIREVTKNRVTSSDSDSLDEFFIGSVVEETSIHTGEKDDNNNDRKSVDEMEASNNDTSSGEWTVSLETNGTDVEFKIDSGAQVNILPLKEYKRLLIKPTVNQTKTKLTAYNGTEIPVIGKCILRLKNSQVPEVPILFTIAETDSPPILGLKSSVSLNLIQRVMSIQGEGDPEIIAEFIDCFAEAGRLNIEPHHIETDPTVKPTVKPPRNIAIGLRDKLKQELNKMVDMKIIEPVTEPTDWVNTLVVVERPDGRLRICLDPQNLNKAIKRQHYRLPTTEDILVNLKGAKYFTKLDASNAYWQIPVDKESSRLLTFNTIYGRFCFLRLAFGIHSASEICQYEISCIISGIEGCANSQDDILIWASTRQLLRKRTRQVLKAIRRSGLKLNRRKCIFNQTEVTFLGHKISGEGIAADPAKIEAISKFPMPQDKKSLQRFLGMVTYLGKFIPHLSDETNVLRELLAKDVAWSFEQRHIKAMNKLKTLISNSPTLQYFDINLPTRTSSDASEFGLGALLEQKQGDEWRPVAYASRSLNPSERNYSQLEKETLSIMFACKKFHDYVYGLKFDVYNDHLPLKPIFQKPLHKCPPRIQRFLLQLQRYDFVMHYIPGTSLTVADALSRAPLENNESELTEEELKTYVHMVVSNIPITEKKQTQLVEETALDPVLTKLKRLVEEGWPASRKEVELGVKPYYNYRDELVYNDGLILKGHRIIVPSSMRREMKTNLHTGHLGIEKINLQARESCYWPGMTSELTEMVETCSACQQYRNKQPQEPIIPHEVPPTPWQKVSADLFSLQGKDYLLTVDYTTGYFDVALIKKQESKTIIQQMKSIFAKYGIPLEVFSDNGPCFDSKEFREFSKCWDFECKTSSPEYPQSNGLVERTVQTIKKTLRKCLIHNNDPYMAMLALRTTPSSNERKSPAYYFFNRELRTNIPKPTSQHPLEIPHKQSTTSTKSTRVLTPLDIDDSVRLFRDGSWSRKGKVVEKCKEPRSYKVQVSNGNVLRRNRRQILKTKERFQKNTSDSSDDDYTYEQDQQNIPYPIQEDQPPPVQPNEDVRPQRERRPPAYLGDYET